MRTREKIAIVRRFLRGESIEKIGSKRPCLTKRERVVAELEVEDAIRWYMLEQDKARQR